MLLAASSSMCPICLPRARDLFGSRESIGGWQTDGGREVRVMRCDTPLTVLRCAHSCRAAVTHLLTADPSPSALFPHRPTDRPSRCGRRLCDADTRSWRTQRDHSRTPLMHSQRQERDQDRTDRQADPRPAAAAAAAWAAPIATRTRPSTPATRAAPSVLPPAAAVVAAWVARRRLRSLRR